MTKPCPTCGTVNQPTAKFCKVCGTALSGATGAVAPPAPPPKTTAPMPPPRPTAPVTPPAQPTAPVAPPVGQVMCPHCGKPNRGTARRCASCGKLLQATAAVPPPPPLPIPPRPPASAPPIAAPPAPAKKGGALGLSLVLLACLVLALCGSLSGIFVYESIQPITETIDVARLSPTATFTPPPPPTTVVIPTHTPTATPNPPYPVVSMKITSDGRFGFRTLQGDPNDPKDDNKPLTYRPERTANLPDGDTNNTRLWVDSERKTPLFGSRDGQFIQTPRLSSNDSEMSAVWQYEKIVITQTVQVVLSASTHRLDTFRIAYTAENRDTVSHTVGMRLMMDTLIGDNDGVPFNVPGRGLVTSPLDLRGNDIPDFVQVYEIPDPNNHGVVVQMTMKGGDATAPDRFVIAPWCKPDGGWDFLAEVGGLANKTLHQCGDQGKGAKEDKLDSAVGIYFDPKLLAPSETREWVTFYGLGEIKKQVATSALSLVKPADRVRVGEEFWIVALVQNPRADQKVKITLPAGLQLTQNPAEQALQSGTTLAQVAWRVRAISPGNDLKIIVELAPENQQEFVTLSVMPLPTPTSTPSPKPCTPSITNPCR